jgi:hypothetical protein
MSVRVFTPSYTSIDDSTVRIIENGDYHQDDAGSMMTLPSIVSTALSLYEAAGRPRTLVYCNSSAALRIYTSRFAVVGARASFIERRERREAMHQKIADLNNGDLDILVNRQPFGDGPEIHVDAVLLASLTLLPAPFQAFLARLRVSTVIDVALNIARFGAPPHWDVRQVVTPASMVITDPMLDQFATLSMRDLQAWAMGDRRRLELIAPARGYKAGWIGISAETWINRQIKNRGQPLRNPELPITARPQRR